MSVEGIDGAGKTSVCRELHRRMTIEGLPVVFLCRDNLEIEDAYVADHISRLRQLIWPKKPDEPQYKLGDRYFLFLLASWFRLLDDHLVVRNLQAGKVVLIDGWIYKTLARNKLRRLISPELVQSCFSGLSTPTLSFLIELPAELAAARKDRITNAESGINDGRQVGGVHGFVSYQQQLAEALSQIVSEQLPNTTKLDGRSKISHNVELIRAAARANLPEQAPKVSLVR